MREYENNFNIHIYKSLWIKGCTAHLATITLLYIRAT